MLISGAERRSVLGVGTRSPQIEAVHANHDFDQCATVSTATFTPRNATLSFVVAM